MARQKAEETKRHIVNKSNDLVRHKKLKKIPLTLTEKKLINFAIAELTPEQLKGDTFPEQVFDVKEFCDAIGVRERGYQKALRELTLNILSKPFEIIKPNFKGDVTLSQLNWFTVCEYNTNKSTITLQFHKDLGPHVLQLKNQYTTYRLEDTLQVKNIYTLDWYELFVSYSSMKNSLEMDMKEIREFLGVLKKYGRDIDVIKACVRKPIKEINDKTDMQVEMEEIIEKQKIVSVVFNFRYKTWEELLNRQGPGQLKMPL